MTFILYRKPLLILVLACVNALWIPPADAQLPDIGDPASTVMTPAEERQLGRRLLWEIRKTMPVVDDLELNYYLNTLGNRLVTTSPEAIAPYTFILIDNGTINAFAMPGGVIAVHRGLIEAAVNESELAAVLAHEIAHVTQRHLARFYEVSRGLDFKTALGVLAAAILSSYSSEAGQAALVGTLAVNADSKLRFSRSNEIDADRSGRKILKDSGYDPQAMGDFFEKLERASLTDPDRVSEFLQTHPLTQSRIADNIQPTETSITPTARKDSLDFQLAKSRLAVLTSPLPKLLNQTTSTIPEDQVQHYLHAMIRLRNRQPEEALEVLKQSTSLATYQPHFRLLEARALLDKGAHQATLSITKELYALYPNLPAVIHLHGETLMANDQPEAAWEMLRKVETGFDTEPALLKLKADAAARNSQQAQSHEALAEYYYYQGEFPLALEHIRLALQSPSISNVMKARLEQNKQDLEELLQKKKNIKK
jgi:predicted Zn-dependent protease